MTIFGLMKKYTEMHESWIQCYKQGMTSAEIGRTFGVDKTTIWTFLNRRGLGSWHTLQSRFEKAPKRQNGECIEWMGCLGNGYGVITYQRKTLKAHRVSYELHHNVKIGNKVVRHTCDNPKCVNPNHLILGSHADNIKDRDARNRTAKGERAARAKLKNTDAMQIRQMRSEGMTYAAIAKKYPVNEVSIRAVCLHITYK